MNNLLPLLILMTALSGGNGEKGGFSPEALKPLLSMLGMNSDLLSAFSSEGPLSGIKDGSLSLEKILPLFASFMGGGQSAGPKKPAENAPGKDKESAGEGFPAPNYLRPISDIAGDEINYALAHYFATN